MSKLAKLVFIDEVPEEEMEKVMSDRIKMMDPESGETSPFMNMLEHLPTGIDTLMRVDQERQNIASMANLSSALAEIRGKVTWPRSPDLSRQIEFFGAPAPPLFCFPVPGIGIQLSRLNIQFCPPEGVRGCLFARQTFQISDFQFSVVRRSCSSRLIPHSHRKKLGAKL